MHKGAGSEAEALALVPGYNENGNLNHRDVYSLGAGGQLVHEVVNEMGRRLVTRADSFVIYNTFGLEKLYPLTYTGETQSQNLSDMWYSRMAGAR